MSSSLLTKRLRQLEQAGLVERRARLDGNGTEYHLTPAGEALGPVVAQMGVWSERWLRRPIFEETPDTGLLMWWMRGTVKPEALPEGRTVIHFHFTAITQSFLHGDVQANGVNLANQNLEGLWNARTVEVFAFNNRFVGLHASDDVV